MSNKITLKKSSIGDKIPGPGDLEYGELALNYTDGNLFYKDSSNAVQTIASNKFVSVTGNVTGNYFIGNGSQLTGISGGSAGGNTIINGTSNVAILAVNGNVQVAVNSVANSVVIGSGSLFVQGPISTPKVINTLALVPNAVNAVMISPLTISAAGNIFVPDNSTLTIFTPT